MNLIYVGTSDDVSVAESKLSSTDSRCSYDSLGNSWYEISSGTSSEDLLSDPQSRYGNVGPTVSTTTISKHISPKVFPPGSSTLNSPASVVLGRHKMPPTSGGGSTIATPKSCSIYNSSVPVYEDRLVSDDDKRTETTTNIAAFSSCESLSPKAKIVPPSPAFDRNPSYFSAKCSSPTNDYAFASPSPSFCGSPARFSNGNITPIPKADKTNGSLSSPTDSYDSVLGLGGENGRKIDYEMRRKQAHQNRILEQERERVERLRLEEILTACVEYEKQAQIDRSNKPQIRIKTNGSLPRDKKGTNLSSLTKFSDSKTNGGGNVFNFDTQDGSGVNSENYTSNGERPSYLNSPRTRIKTVASPKISRKDYAYEVFENTIASRNDYHNSSSCLSHNDGEDRLNATVARASPAAAAAAAAIVHPNSVPYANTQKMDTAMSRSYHESLSSASFDADESGGGDVMSTSLIQFDDRRGGGTKSSSNFSSDDYAKSKSRSLSKLEAADDARRKLTRDDEIERLNGLVTELDEFAVGKTTKNGISARKLIVSPANESKFILPLEEIDTVLRRQRFSVKKCELKKLQNEQSRLLDAINNVKTKLLDIQQQKDEIIRELEMEKALLEGELRSENDKLIASETVLTKCNERMAQCEQQIETCSKQQIERRDHNKSIINEQQNKLNVLQSNLSCTETEDDKASIVESIGKCREILEEETKSYEDFEFKLLEEEATLLSKRDELQSDIARIAADVEHTRTKIAGLYSQKEQLLQNASDEIKSLELQVRGHTRTLQQNHSRLQEIGQQLKETSSTLKEITENANKSCDETSFYAYKTQSQEDLDRISRVTTDAPILETGGSNSLGRRTIASLQQIEKNRQMHLAQQGGQVIEEERKRMLALKRRVQDEVKAQWEEDRKQRENNCSSITSVCSDNSSVMSFDRVTESPTSDDKSSKTNASDKRSLADGSNAADISRSSTQNVENDDDRCTSTKSKRPSNAVSAAKENDASVKLRASRLGNSNNLRPYSVYRRQSLDLRRHIESAGHQVDHCPHVFVDKTSCRGYLQKMTTKFRSWNKRWFVFDRKKCSFTYYSDKSEKKLKGGAYFQGLVDLCIDNSNVIRSPNPQATFILKSTERVYYLLAPSIEAMRIWFDVLATEVETYQDC